MIVSVTTVVVALQLVVLHRVDGRELFINPEQIAAVAAPRPSSTVNREVKCIVFMTDGKQYAVADTCAEVKRLLESR